MAITRKHRPAEKYRKQNGHWVGNDGFIIPNNFIEFYERFPNYTEQWARKNIRRPAVYDRDDILDWGSELNLFLCSLPVNSIRRTSKITDVVGAFDPTKCHGCSRARFFTFINRALSNRFKTLWTKFQRDSLRRVDNEQLQEQGVESEYDDSPAILPAVLDACCSSRELEHSEQSIFLEQYRNFVLAHDSTLVPLLDSVYQFNSLRKTRQHLGWTSTSLEHGMERLQVLAACFTNNTSIPVPRKRYRRNKIAA
jgi:hypothetical protein